MANQPQTLTLDEVLDLIASLREELVAVQRFIEQLNLAPPEQGAPTNNFQHQ